MIRLNLIPQNRKEEIAQDGRFRTVLKWGFELSATLVIFAAILGSVNYILLINLRSVSNRIESDERNDEKHREMKQYDSEIRKLNAKISDIEKISRSQLYWSGFFEKINWQIIPEIEIINILTQDYAVLLSGKAQNRDKMLEFKENLVKEECFTDVNLPLSNLVARENIEFQLDLKIKPECINLPR